MLRVFRRIAVIIVAMVMGAILTISFTFWLRDRYVVPILTYHHVSPGANPDLLTVTPQVFEQQMKFIRDNGYQVITFHDLVNGIKHGRAFEHYTVAIHFDDGYEDNYTYAYPILKKHEMPAMIFLISDKVGTPGFVTWDQVKEMDSNGVNAGAHTRHHVYLPDVTLDQARDEIAGSKRIIEGHLGHPIDYFVYPNGGFSDEVKKIVRQEGFKAAATTNRGQFKYNRDPYEIKRIRVKDSDHPLILWGKLSGYYNFFRKSKDCY